MISYQAILQNLSAAIVALDTAQYQSAPSDAWHPTRNLGPLSQDWEHLQFAIDLGGAATQGRANCLVHEGCVIEFAYRDSSDGDFTTQGAMLDAARDIADLMTTWGMSGVTCRTVPEGFGPILSDGEFAKVRIPFHMQITNWRA